MKPTAHPALLLSVLMLSLASCDHTARVSQGQPVAPGACSVYAWAAQEDAETLTATLTLKGDASSPAATLGTLIFVREPTGSVYRFKTSLGSLLVKDVGALSVRAFIAGGRITLRAGPEDTITHPTDGVPHACLLETLASPKGMSAAAKLEED